jgi:hypothetical protein
MSHSTHTDSAGASLPSVSQIPGIFAQDMSGFEDWICRQEHGKDDRCCTAAKRHYYSEAADLGNDVHALREAFLRGETFEEGVPEYQAAVFEPVAKFYKESGYKPLEMIYETEKTSIKTPYYAVELKMTGKEFGGTLDGAGTFSVPFWEKQRKTFYDSHSTKWILDHEEFPDLCLPTTKSVWIEDLKIKSKLDLLHPLQLYVVRRSWINVQRYNLKPTTCLHTRLNGMRQC